MTIAVWQPGQSYPTGSLARPTGGGAVVPSQVVNGTFESGDVDWTKGTGWTINSGDQPFQGTWSAKFNTTGTTNLDSQNDVPVTPGQSITCSAMVQQGASSAGQAGARVILVWLDGSGAEVSTSQGNLVDSASGGAWKMSTVTATAPAGAETVFARVTAFRTGGSNPLWVDNVLWNYTVPNPGTGLIYQAVQPDTGTSASSEPAWPTVLGVQVNDGSVVWEAIGDTRIEWTARPILESGATEPTWPTIPGEFVSDGNIAWECVVRNVTDERCPNTKVVLIAASKIFAVDEDIVAFSATVNPLDWSTEGDAGYLPTGLQQYGANPMAALGLYRGNLVAWNSQGMQIWQVDEDPARMQLLDALPIGSTYPKAVSPVQNDLFFLTQLGVRSLGIAGGSVNLQAGDVGMPIDPLIRESLADAEAVSETGLSAYYPAQGQYFLAFTTVPGEGIDISNPLEEAFLNVPVDHQYVVTGGIGPYEFVIDRGSLPTGLVMDSLGNITGTPTEEGEFAWRVRVYDSTLRSDALDEGIDLAEGIDGGSEFVVLPEFGYWWLSGAEEGKVYVTTNPRDWTSASLITRTPHIFPDDSGVGGGGYYRVDSTKAVMLNSDGECEVVTGLNISGTIMPVISIPVATATPYRIQVFGGVIFAMNAVGGSTYYTSTDGGTTWNTRSAPSGRAKSIGQLPSGRWVIRDDFTSPRRAWWSDDITEPTSWTEAATPVNQGLNGTLISIGSQVLGFGGEKILSTTDGNTWTISAAVTTAFNGGCGAASGDTIIFGDTNAAKLVRSTDGGATWADVAFRTTRRIDVYNGFWVAACPTSSGGIFYSDDDGATWTAATLPPGVTPTFYTALYANPIGQLP